MERVQLNGADIEYDVCGSGVPHAQMVMSALPPHVRCN